MLLFVAFLVFGTFIFGETTDSDKYAECGIRSLKNSNRAKRITGGTASIEGSWPWMVAVVADKGNSETDTFAGTLIGKKWILTSGRGALLSNESYSVFLGDTNLKAMSTSKTSQYRKVVNIHVHEWVDTMYDVAIMELNEPVVYTETMRPVCLAKLTPLLKNTPSLTVLGWGLDMAKEDVNTMWLQEKKMKFVDHASCKKIADAHASEVREFNVSALMGLGNKYGVICAQDEDGKAAACNGDSGGPLMIEGQHGNWYEVGVLSFYTARNCNAENDISGYVFVERLCGFVKEKTRDEVHCHMPYYPVTSTASPNSKIASEISNPPPPPTPSSSSFPSNPTTLSSRHSEKTTTKRPWNAASKNGPSFTF